MHYRYHRIISHRTNKNSLDFDEYLNIYKYQKNAKKRRTRLEKSLTRKTKNLWSYIADKKSLWLLSKKNQKLKKTKKEENSRFSIISRFKKGALYQQILQEFGEISCQIPGILFRVRQPLRRLRFFDDKFAKAFYRTIPFLAKQKYFINTVYHIILLHYYRAVTPFSQHFGRELQKIRKQVHWRLIYHFRSLLHIVPSHSRLRRQFYGISIEIAGRPRGRSRTFIFRITQGTIAPQTFRFRVSLGYGVAFAKVGLFGIRTRVAY